MAKDDLGEHLEDWIDDTRSSFDRLPASPWSSAYADQYSRVLTHASEQLDRMLSDFHAFINDLEHDRIPDPADALFRYVIAMSVAVGDEPIFLPSFSDKCLEILVQDRPFGGLSPFRGIYYAWHLGDIAKALQAKDPYRFRRVIHNFDEWEWAFSRLRTLRSQLEDDLRQQRSPTYSAYRAALTPKTHAPLDPALIRQIEYVKSSIRFGVNRKRRWLGMLPYQCQHSTHFYLSGIRFYWSPLLEDKPASTWNGTEHPMDRFCVNSTDSGLVMPAERYGMLLPEGTTESSTESSIEHCVEELAELIPIGSLFLDLSDRSATKEDVQSLRYFENWSRLITSAAYAVVSETLERHDACAESNSSRKHRSEFAKTTFLSAVRKNPLRTLYFDTGIIGAARVAARQVKQLPPIQYHTTARSVPAKDSWAERFLSESLLIGQEGLEFFVSSQEEFPGLLKAFTLVPVGDSLRERTSFLWSIRGDASKIAHGFEGSVRQIKVQSVKETASEHMPIELFATGAGGTATTLAALLSSVGPALPVSEIFALATAGLICAGVAWKRGQQHEREVTKAMRDLRHLQGVHRIRDNTDLAVFR